MSIRKKILLLFALLISLTGVIAWRGYQAYIAIIKQHEIVDLKDETTNAATRLNNSLRHMQVQATIVGGESTVREFLAAGDKADEASVRAVEGRLGRLLQQPGKHFVRARLLDKTGHARACVARLDWQDFPPGETFDRRADRVAGETAESIEFEACDANMPLLQDAPSGSPRPDGPDMRIVHEGRKPLMVSVMPIGDNGERLGYVEISQDLRYDVLDEMVSPRFVTLITNAHGVLALDAGDSAGLPPDTKEPIGSYIAELAACFDDSDPQFDFQTIKAFTRPDTPGMGAYDELFQHAFLVARYPETKMGRRLLKERRALGDKIERALMEWRGDDSNRRFFKLSETLQRDSRIVVCAATMAELDEVRELLDKASDGELQIDDPRETGEFAVQFQKIYWDPQDRTRFFGLVRAASIQEIEADVSSELWRRTKVPLLGIAVALALIALWGPGFIAKPLAKFTKGAERIARGDLQKVEVPRTHDEVERLAVAFNDMVVALSERRELKTANEQLAKAKQDLERAQTSREEFLASVSHELRSPLTTVDGYCRRLLKTELSERQRSDVGRILSASERLLRLVKDILDYQKVVMGRLPLEPRDFDLATRVRDVVEESQPRAAERGLALRLESRVDSLPIHADADRVAQVLDNLIGNSLKFTRQGEIVCRLRQEKRGDTEWAVVEVQDTGRGMTAEQQSQLFLPFVKFLENSENPTGTGLGLAICRGICRASGGDVRVDADRTVVGSGSTFVVELPLSPVKFSTTWTSPPPRKGGLAAMDSGISFVPGASNLALVIDDDPDVAELIKRFFKEHEFAVAVATSGVTGLEDAKRLRPSLITLDVEMPGLDGWQVLRLLKSEAATADIPVILVTIAEDQRRGFAMGATDYLTKPIDWNRLGGLIDRFRLNGDGGKVLVVEDDDGQRELLASGLRSRGCEVVEAANGRRALEALEGFVPDLILLDLIMPEMDGFQFLSALRDREEFRDHDKLRDATVVVVSGKELDEADYERLRGQVAEVIAKGEASWDEIQRELARLVKLHVSQRTVTGGSAR